METDQQQQSSATTTTATSSEEVRKKRKYIRSGRYSKFHIRALDLILQNIGSYSNDEVSLLSSYVHRMQDAIEQRQRFVERQLPVPPPSLGMPRIDPIPPPAPVIMDAATIKIAPLRL